MKFSIAVLTAPRPQPTLGRTLDSLVASGWDRESIFVFNGKPPDGEKTSPQWCTRAYIYMMCHAACRMPGDADGCLVCEDDVVFCRNAREYLESIPWPEDVGQIAAVSPYCHTAYSNYDKFPRWHREDHRVTLAGTQAFIYTRKTLSLLPHELDPKSKDGIDVQFGHFAQRHGLHVWYHVPSLVQHIGVGGNSAVGYTDCGTIYRSESFVGEDFDARSLL